MWPQAPRWPLPGVAGRALAAPEDPLHFVGWQYNPQIVAENVETFKTLNDENVNYELVPGEYHAVVETKLIAGQHIDMMYSEEDRILRWNRAGWTRSLDGLPGLDEIKANMYDVNVHNMSLPDGSLGGMPTTPVSTRSWSIRTIWTRPASRRPPPGTSCWINAAS